WIIKFRRVVTPGHQDCSVIEQGGCVPTSGREHGASRGEGSCRRVVKLGAGQRRVIIETSSGDQDPAISEQGGRVSASWSDHLAGCTEGAGNWIEEFCAGRSIAPSPGDQHLAVHEKAGCMASARRRHITCGYERARSLRDGFESRAE